MVREIIYTGQVHKKGELLKTWKVRKIELEKVDGELFLNYYQGNELKGSLKIVRASETIGMFGASLTNIYHNKRRCLVVFTKSHGKNKRLMIHCNSDEKTIELQKKILVAIDEIENPISESKRVLVITSSPMGNFSASNQVASAFIEEYKKLYPKDTVKAIDISSRYLPPFTAKRVQAKFATWEGKEEPEGTQQEWNFTKDLIDEFCDADKYVIATPMWNFGIPNRLKLYFDHIVQPWKTFNPTKLQGGFVVGKPALIIAAAGTELLGSPLDYVSTYLKAILGYIGFTDVRTVFIGGTADPEKVKLSIKQAIEEVKTIIPQFHYDIQNKLNLSNNDSSIIPLKNPSPIGKRVLAIVSSPMGQFSVSSSILNAFLDEYKRKVPDAVIHTFDIFQRNLLPFNAERVQAKFAPFTGKDIPPNAAEAWKYTLGLIDEFMWADTYVFAVPMWNLGIPNQLKLYFDHIVQPFKTFDPTKAEGGLVTGRPCFLLCSAGGPTLGTPYDYVTPYLKAVLGMIGITDLRPVWVNNTTIDRNKAIEDGIRSSRLLLEAAVPKADGETKKTSVSEAKPYNVLVITSSPMGNFSASNQVTTAFIEEYKLKYPDHVIRTIDLSARNLPRFTSKRVQAKFATWGGKDEPEGTQEEWSITKELIDEFLKADKYVFAVPMWNFGIPNQMKLYFDHIVQPWKTFDPTKPVGGLVLGKPALIIAASGGGLLGTPLDFTSTHLKAMLKLIGFSDVRTIFVNGTASDKSSEVIATATNQAKAIIPNFQFDPNATIDLPDNFKETTIVDPLPIGKRVLAIVSSPMGQFSASTSVLNAFLDEYKRKVPDAVIHTFDIFQRNLLPFNAERVQAKFAPFTGKDIPPNAAEAWKYTLGLIDEFMWADTYVFAVPMWNLGVPNQLKLYFDHIVQPFKTFDPTKAEGGLVTGRPCFLLCSAGLETLGTPYDYVTPYLKAVLGMIGITDLRKVWINGTALGNKSLVKEKTAEALKLLSDSYVTFTPFSAIEKLLKSYEEALNAKDIARLTSLYSENARLTINNYGNADSVGTDQISEALDEFLQYSNRVYLEIVDIVEHSNFAHASIIARCVRNSQAYRENFCLHKDPTWKIVTHVTNIKFAPQ